MKAELRYVLVAFGEQSVMTFGEILTRWLSVTSWAILHKVCLIT